ncbi:SRPBCC domain-containing protein [Streptomyces sp. GC420]|uniref:SRPBCC family protein n=1 Tax=Streptomyces sp. GC420 TaxID=2697568 RepID=UPI001414EDFE|nr:SRPBCC domain-containing protein [Streptomyces sp. GC420]NBM18082.1 SRPBCC domain-containing protein [Streptomyces sp. GC420]
MSTNTTGTGYSYTAARGFDVPVAAVWDAWTKPEQYAQWAGAVEGSVEMDVREGGKWKAAMATPDGMEFPLTGSYVDVVEGERLVIGMDMPGSPEQAVMTVTLAAKGDGAAIEVSQTCGTAAERDQAEAGTGMLLDGLAAFLRA